MLSSSLDKLGVDPTRPQKEQQNPSLLKAILDRKLYTNVVGGRVVDDKKVLESLSVSDVAICELTKDQLHEYLTPEIRTAIVERGGINALLNPVTEPAPVTEPKPVEGTE